MNKKTTLFCVLFFFQLIFVFAQTKGTFVKSEINVAGQKYMFQNLNYPRPMRDGGKQGITVIQVTLNERGMTDSLDIVQAVSKESAEDVVKTLIAIGNMWTPTQMDGKNIRYKYKVVFRYAIAGASNSISDAQSLKEQAERRMKKNKFEEALTAISKAIALNPYDSGLYLIKSQIHAKMGNAESALNESEKAAQISREIIGPFDIVGSSSTSVSRL